MRIGVVVQQDFTRRKEKIKVMGEGHVADPEIWYTTVHLIISKNSHWGKYNIASSKQIYV
jgi:hypothetical protein